MVFSASRLPISSETPKIRNVHCLHASRDWNMCATINAKPMNNARNTRVKFDFTRDVYRARTSVVAQPPYVHGPGFTFFNERKSAIVNVYGTIQKPVEKKINTIFRLNTLLRKIKQKFRNHKKKPYVLLEFNFFFFCFFSSGFSIFSDRAGNIFVHRFCASDDERQTDNQSRKSVGVGHA